MQRNLFKNTCKSMQPFRTDSCFNEVNSKKIIRDTKKLLFLFVQKAMRQGWTIEFLRQKIKEETFVIQVNDGDNRQYYIPIKDFDSLSNLEEILKSSPSVGKFTVLFNRKDEQWYLSRTCEILGISMAVHPSEVVPLLASYKEEDLERKAREETEQILRIMFGEKESEVAELRLKMRQITEEVVEDFLVGCSDKKEVDGKDIVKMCEQKILGDIRFKLQFPVKNLIRRDKCLQELHDRLQRYRRVVVRGSVGVGKSELLKAYVKERGFEYHNIVWIESKEVERVQELYKELAHEKIGILRNGTDGKEKRFETVVSDVYRFFRDKKALFVFDGAEAPSSAPLPKSVSESNPYVVITSRHSVWEVENMMNLGPFEEKEAEQCIPSNRYDSILLKCLDYNPFLLTKLKGNEIHPKESEYELSLSEILPNKSGGDSSVKLYFCEGDVSRLKSTLKVLTEAACTILKELISLKDTGEINSILSRGEKKEMLLGILNLKENSMLEVSHGKLILPKAVRALLHSYKW